MWTAFTDSQAQVILFHAIGFALACFIVYQGELQVELKNSVK